MLLNVILNRCSAVLLAMLFLLGAGNQLKAAMGMEPDVFFHRSFIGAAREGDVEIIELLLSNPSVKNSTILGALRIALEVKQYLVLTLLRTYIQRSRDRGLHFSASIIIEEFTTPPPGGDIDKAP